MHRPHDADPLSSDFRKAAALINISQSMLRPGGRPFSSSPFISASLQGSHLWLCVAVPLQGCMYWEKPWWEESQCPPAEVRAKTRNLEDAPNVLEKSAPLSQGSTHVI